MSSNEHNRRVWNQMAAKQARFTRPASDDDFRNPLATVDGLGWLGGDIRNRSVLCLAAGGGRQGPLYAAAGAKVTVVDISGAMLEIDREVARQRRLDLVTVETSMDDLSMFRAGEFEIVIHPVSTCYVPDVAPTFAEVARVTQANAIYISQHKQPVSLQTTLEGSVGRFELEQKYYRDEPLPSASGSRLREEGALEYLHRWEQLVGGICRAGFMIEDLVEPFHADPQADAGSFGNRAMYVAPYVRIKARRKTSDIQTATPLILS